MTSNQTAALDFFVQYVANSWPVAVLGLLVGIVISVVNVSSGALRLSLYLLGTLFVSLAFFAFETARLDRYDDMLWMGWLFAMIPTALILVIAGAVVGKMFRILVSASMS